MSDQSFSNQLRIRKQADFDRVHGNDAFAADDVLVVRGCANELDHPRLGLSVSRKVGNAVVRNRWKRLIREAFRTSRQRIPSGYDFVVRPRRGAIASFEAVRKSLPDLARRVARRCERKVQR